MKTAALLFLVLLAAAGSAEAAPAPVLTVRVQADAIDYAGGITLVVTFENRSDETVKYFEPPHVILRTFPAVTFVSEATGAIWRPYDSPFQSMAGRGLEGAVIELAPGEKKEYRHVRDRFSPVVAGKMDWTAKRPLPPGKYRIRVEYEKADDRAHFNIGGFDTELRKLPGIFVGKLVAVPATIVVRPADRPRIEIAPPAGRRAEIVLTFDNPTPEDRVFAGTPRLVLSSKMYGSGEARPAVIRDGDAKPDERIEVRVPAGERKVFRVRLGALSFAGRGPGMHGFGELIPEGLAHAVFTLHAEGGVKSLGTDGIFVRIPRPRNKGLEGLRVTATLPEVVKVGDPFSLTVTVENGSGKDALLLHRMAFPRDVIIRFEDMDGGRPSIGSVTRKAGGLDALRPRGEGASRVAAGLSWNGDAFARVGGIGKSDLIWIESGDGFEKTFDFRKLLAKGPTPGRYLITVGYRNYESGERLGFVAGRRAGVGIVWSKPVVVAVR